MKITQNIIYSIILISIASFTIFAQNSPGDLDSTFDFDGKVVTDINMGIDAAADVAVQADNKIVAVGFSEDSNEFITTVLVRYNTDGSLDTSFGQGGIVNISLGTESSAARAVAIQPDGKIVIAGITAGIDFRDFLLIRFNTDGSVDTSFGNNGVVLSSVSNGGDTTADLALQSDGKIVLGGYSFFNPTQSAFVLIRYNTDGTLDNFFGSGGIVTTSFGDEKHLGGSVAIQADGKIILAGANGSLANRDFVVLRYNTNGSLDTTFDNDGIVTTDFNGGSDFGAEVAIQPTDGRIVVAGIASNGTNNDIALARYNTDGSLDNSFGQAGKVTTQIGTKDDIGRGVAIQSNGNIVVGGETRDGLVNQFAVVRYLNDGSIDTSFGNNGVSKFDFETANDIALAIALDSDEKIVIAGKSAVNDFAVARVLCDSTSTQLTTIQGRVKRRNGRGIPNALIRLRDSEGNVRRIRTNRRGFFSFDDVVVGERYVINARSRRFQIRRPTRIIDAIENTPRVIFIAR